MVHPSAVFKPNLFVGDALQDLKIHLKSIFLHHVDVAAEFTRVVRSERVPNRRKRDGAERLNCPVLAAV